MAKKVAIQNSCIHGKGIFAQEDIKSEEEILVMDDSHVVINLGILSQHQLDYECDFLAEGRVVLMQEPEVFINHSCDPNAYVKTVDGVRRTFAMRDIKTGEELTFDYAVNGENEGTFKCHCGNANCRKNYIGNFFSLPLEAQKKYLPYLDSWFVEKHRARILVLNHSH
ncbi:MAG: SET domain-containing protein-lysine N-methyltransferase [Chloroflexi bacterium]|nr:SET domain-containing protein-lysine N-methyltransferase [Chloroflexota bacterium]